MRMAFLVWMPNVHRNIIWSRYSSLFLLPCRKLILTHVSSSYKFRATLRWPNAIILLLASAAVTYGGDALNSRIRYRILVDGHITTMY